MLGASVEWHLSFPLMNNLNKTEAAIFPYRLCLLMAFPFISLIIPLTQVGQALDTDTVAL